MIIRSFILSIGIFWFNILPNFAFLSSLRVPTSSHPAHFAQTGVPPEDAYENTSRAKRFFKKKKISRIISTKGGVPKEPIGAKQRSVHEDRISSGSELNPSDEPKNPEAAAYTTKANDCIGRGEL